MLEYHVSTVRRQASRQQGQPGLDRFKRLLGASIMLESFAV